MTPSRTVPPEAQRVFKRLASASSSLPASGTPLTTVTPLPLRPFVSRPTRTMPSPAGTFFFGVSLHLHENAGFPQSRHFEAPLLDQTMRDTGGLQAAVKDGRESSYHGEGLHPWQDAGVPRPVLVTGASGYVGRALVALLQRRGDLVCAWTGRGGGPDIRDEAAVHARIAADRPAVVIHLVTAQAGASEEELAAVNVAGARHVAAAAAAVGAHLVHVSSDMVHDGTSAPYADDAPARPVTAYGRSKAAGEDAVLAVSAHALVVRTSLVIDPHDPDRATRGFLDRARRGEDVVLFTDEVRSAVRRDAFVEALVDLVDQPVHGRLNVAGPEPLTRRALGEAFLRRALGAEGLRTVRALTRAQAGVPDRPADLSLDSSQAYRVLGRSLPPLLPLAG